MDKELISVAKTLYANMFLCEEIDADMQNIHNMCNTAKLNSTIEKASLGLSLVLALDGTIEFPEKYTFWINMVQENIEGDDGLMYCLGYFTTRESGKIQLLFTTKFPKPFEFHRGYYRFEIKVAYENQNPNEALDHGVVIGRRLFKIE
ncbi:hypothetical protein [Blautia celeris]|uniref:hypothetical protein n=1 Tax=Blautia celeris TaxID=2763026 RepID=UPI00210E1963|nr:hypothetical protein [Blautia producta]